MPTCAIVGCNNGSGREKPRENGRKPSVFCYTLTEAKKEWVEIINRENYTPNKCTVICEDHFTEDAYIPEEQNIDKHNRKRKRRRLKPKAFPTRNLPTANSVLAAPDKRSRKIKVLKPIESIPTSSMEDSNLGVHSYAKMPILEQANFNEHSIFSEIQLKLEPEAEENNSESTFSVNPWDVSNASVFLSYCCPECDFKSGNLLGFSQHAVINHVLSNILFGERELEDLYESFTIENNVSGQEFDMNGEFDGNLKFVTTPQKSVNNLSRNAQDIFKKSLDISSDRNINPFVNSNEVKIKLEDCTDDPISDIKTESYELDIVDPFIEHDKTIEPDTNIEINSNKKKSLNLDALRSDFPEASVNLENLSDELEKNGKMLEKLKSLKQKKIDEQVQSDESGKKLEKKGTGICDICGFTSTLQGLKNHMRMHENKCSICKAKFLFEIQLKKHTEAKHPGTSDKCGENREKQGEKRNKETKETVICDVCGFKTNPQGLPKHVKMVHEKNFLCPYCDTKFPYECRLEYHIEAKHPGTSELKHFCSECGDGFMFEKNMVKHSETHKKMDELVHQGHEEKKRQKCSICGKRFSKRHFLRKHIERVHEIPKESIQSGHMETVKETDSISIDGVQNSDKTNQLCAKCGQHFTNLIDLVHHFFKEHKKLGEDFDCPMCPKIISLKHCTSKASVMEHIRNTHLQETKKCPDCKQIYKISNFRRHRRLVHGVRYHTKQSKLPAQAPTPTSSGYECPACKKVLGTKGSK